MAPRPRNISSVHSVTVSGIASGPRSDDGDFLAHESLSCDFDGHSCNLVRENSRAYRRVGLCCSSPSPQLLTLPLTSSFTRLT